MSAIHLRPCVQHFAECMELQLQANDHKPGWTRDTPRSLYMRLVEEVWELEQAMPKFEKQSVNLEAVIKEAADVANFAMMIADNARRSAEQAVRAARSAQQ